MEDQQDNQGNLSYQHRYTNHRQHHTLNNPIDLLSELNTINPLIFIFYINNYKIYNHCKV